MKYTSIEELVTCGPGVLEEDDQVIFEVDCETYEYYVEEDHLEIGDGCDEAIFEALGIDGTSEREEFCNAFYGYESEGCYSWPESNCEDFKALTRLVIGLFAKTGQIVGKGAKTVEVDGHTFKVCVLKKALEKAEKEDC